MKRSKIKHSRSNQVFYIFNTIFWIIFMFLIIYPLYLVCIASVSDPDAIVAGKVIWHPVFIDWIQGCIRVYRILDFVSQLIYLYDIECGHQYYRDIDSSVFSFQTEISWKGSNQYVLCYHNVF